MDRTSGVKRITRILIRFLKWIFIFCGAVFLTFFILCFTHVPHLWVYRLGTSDAGIHRPPDFIVVMGGAGMPSESALIRTYYASNLARYYPKAGIIITLPGDTTDSVSSVNLMKREMVIRGIDPARIRLEAEGTNTRAEVLNIAKMLSGVKQPGLAVVTSPEHMRRSVLCFRKLGFLKVDGLAAFSNPIEAGLTYEDRNLGGRDWMIPDVGNNLMVRYKFWLQARNLEAALRETVALAYYKLKGWI
ncbi:MAG TPA: YdcF family protein [Bacteroidales bacterium]|nr:YdcF family protein [Bacteroidales bacterium]